MCASSCAITPASSSRLSDCIRPVVTATAAFCGLRPVANALGCASSITNTRGIGRPARPASSATRWTRSGALCAVDLMGAVHRQHHAVRIPVGEQVGRGRDHERDQRAAGAADQIADAHEEAGETGQQNGSLQIAHCRLLAACGRDAGAGIPEVRIAPAALQDAGGASRRRAGRRKPPPGPDYRTVIWRLRVPFGHPAGCPSPACTTPRAPSTLRGNERRAGLFLRE